MGSRVATAEKFPFFFFSFFLCFLSFSPYLFRFFSSGVVVVCVCVYFSNSVVFAMEYLPGGDLYERLSDKGTLPLGEAVAWVAQAVLAIEDLHALNIVHRDIKPGESSRVRGFTCRTDIPGIMYCDVQTYHPPI